MSTLDYQSVRIGDPSLDEMASQFIDPDLFNTIMTSTESVRPPVSLQISTPGETSRQFDEMILEVLRAQPPRFYSTVAPPGVAPNQTVQFQPSFQTQTTYPGLLDVLRESLSVRTKLSLDGTDLTIRTQLIFTEGDKETIISEDEDSVDVSELVDNI